MITMATTVPPTVWSGTRGEVSAQKCLPRRLSRESLLILYRGCQTVGRVVATVITRSTSTSRLMEDGNARSAAFYIRRYSIKESADGFGFIVNAHRRRK